MPWLEFHEKPGIPVCGQIPYLLSGRGHREPGWEGEVRLRSDQAKQDKDGVPMRRSVPTTGLFPALGKPGSLELKSRVES